MKIPDLPTDNIYKFICFAGLSLIIISPIYYQVFTHKVLLKNMDLRLEIDLSETKMKYLEKDLGSLEKNVEEADKTLEIGEEHVKGNLENLEKNIVVKKIIEKQIVKNKIIENNVLRLRDVSRDNRMGRVKMDRLAKEVFFLNELHNRLKRYSIAGFVCGFFLFGVGLYFWYTKIQIYEDIIIKKKAQNQHRE